MYEIGKTYNTPKGKILIIDRTKKQYLPNGKVKHPRAVIKILKTGTILDVQTCNIGAGKFNDYREPTVYGVGYIGSGIKIPARESHSIIRRIYDLWANMLKRCYGGYRTCYKECTVDPRWHSFTNFLNSVTELEGYELWEKDSSYCLDKDTKLGYCKIYSKDHCRFILNGDNVRESLDRRWHRK